MPINQRQILTLVTQVCEEENLRVCVTESLKGGAIAGSTTIIGGLLGGPIGLALGGMIGGLAAMAVSRGKFKSVADVIRNDLTPMQKQRLSDSLMGIVNNIGPADLLMLTGATYALQGDLRLLMLQEVHNFFMSQLHMPIVD